MINKTKEVGMSANVKITKHKFFERNLLTFSLIIIALIFSFTAIIITNKPQVKYTDGWLNYIHKNKIVSCYLEKENTNCEVIYKENK